MAIWQPVALAIALTVLPVAAYAQADDNSEADTFPASEARPSLDCRGTGLKIGAAEVSGARFVCQVSGAPSSDSSFSVQAMSIAVPFFSSSRLSDWSAICLLRGVALIECDTDPVLRPPYDVARQLQSIFRYS